MVRTWAWEVAAMLSSIGCISAIVVILSIYDKHEVVTFFDGITLNAVISLLSTFGKTTLLFVLGSTLGQQKWILYSQKSRLLIDAHIIDEASRGPLGSLWALWKIRTSWVLVDFCTPPNLLKHLSIVLSHRLVLYARFLRWPSIRSHSS